MVFRIIGTGPKGAQEFPCKNANEAIAKMVELGRDGFVKIVIKDNFKRTLTPDDLIMLSQQ